MALCTSASRFAMRASRVRAGSSIFAGTTQKHKVDAFGYGNMNPSWHTEVKPIPSKDYDGGYKNAFGKGDIVPADGFGYQAYQKMPPSTPAGWAKYFGAAFTTLPKYKEIIEGIGYPGQKHNMGGMTNVGRIYYGPGRYDYGRVKMPKGWFSNFFYGLWEFFHIFFVVDRNLLIRSLKHLTFIGLCYFPMYLNMKWTAEMWNEFKKTHSM